ncbi:MAG: MFS transporter [Cycloclasticus sp.]|nr:MFS transporter [Cycloclasticus sp.]MBG95355.1 MFS transporter [Cycloclasticus sp.]HAI97848.1 MFS transporter [Methylococcaceae bacterium]|tara:strand:+ start:3412 stop:4791 length:1380 start_codon:yes stop_codon:yes gene_type:complete
MAESSGQTSIMSEQEKRASLGLAGIFSMRMLGLFMILPVMALYTEHLDGITPVLLGLSISIYGLTQALLQIPFGLMSDRFGRKKIITIGLLLFLIGSVVAAMSTTIYGIIMGRALQGSGAVAAAIMALAADLTLEQNRTKIMATIGISIGVSFGVAMVLGPVLASFIGLQGIFWFTALLAAAGIFLLYNVVPEAKNIAVHRDAEPIPALMGKVLKDTQLLRLDFGIFCLHLVMTAMFVVLPLLMRGKLGLAAENHWMVYLPVLGLSVVAMVPFIIIAEKKRKMKLVFVSAIATLSLASLGLYLFSGSLWGMVASLFVFFTAFNLLEASLPSLISKIAFAGGKGTAMGVYSSAQFFGAFCGGLIGGLVWSQYGLLDVFLVCAVILFVWFLVALSMKSPRHMSSLLKNVDVETDEQAKQITDKLLAVKGVLDVGISVDDSTAYLKVDNELLDEAALDAIIS